MGRVSMGRMDNRHLLETNCNANIKQISFANYLTVKALDKQKKAQGVRRSFQSRPSEAENRQKKNVLAEERHR